LNPNLVAPQQLAADRAFPPLSPLGKTPTPRPRPFARFPALAKTRFRACSDIGRSFLD